MNQRAPFKILLKMFQDRFFEDDTVSPGSGFETNIYQVLGFLFTVGFFVAYLAMPAFLELTFQKVRTPVVTWALRDFRLFFPAFSFAVIGFTTVFQWDMLFPDRRDFLILSQFPVPLRDVFAAKCGALLIFLGLLTGALNFFPTAASAFFCMFKADAWGFGLRLIIAQVTASAGAAVFAFFFIGALQGILINATSPRIFRRISPWVQTIGMSLMVLSAFGYPVYVLLLKPAAEARAAWLWFFPPVWFTGIYDILLPGGDPFFASLGYYGIKVLAIVILCFCLTWAFGFKSHFQRTLETEDTLARPPAQGRFRGMASSPEEWAIFVFCRKTLARSTKHRLFLATWLSVGISAAMFVGLSVRSGKIELSQEGLRIVPFLIAFFVISGFRTVFQFPSDLACNWVLQITESRWTETARRAARKVVLICGLVPLLLASMPFEAEIFGAAAAVLHVVFQLIAGALLIEVTFWSFGKVPFTCSYFAGRTSLSVLAIVYLYGFTTYSFNMADLEKGMDERAIRALIFMAAGIAALVILGRRTPASAEVIFDGSESLIQSLDLN
ncbi:MAG TPA: hypothetical protein VG273_06925 [Bryobacteraceae bacterium]|jgi:hypothetical protein|nr:hypothetical protein [Bryobacteraceae bacterium]